MSTTVNVAVAQLPDSSVALTVYDPGLVCVGTLIRTVKLPFGSVITELGTEGIVVPSQLIVIFELFENPEPTTVVDAKPAYRVSERCL